MLKKYQPLLLVLLAYIVVGVFYPIITADFVNLDDNVMVLCNEYVKNFSLENLGKMFSTPYYKLYHPLVTLSFAFEYFFCKLDPFLYHIDNLLLHIFNTILIFFIIRRMTKSFFVSYFTAAVFAIHPLHIEAVSWISSRKDTLYAFFFLLSLWSYMKADESTEFKGFRNYFLISLGAFLLSCLSKATAVTLPLFLVLVDFCRGRFSLATIKRYIPYVIISAVFVFVAITIHYSPEEKVISTLFFKYVSFINAHFNILFYEYKFLFPLSLSCLYPYFFGGHSVTPWYIFFAPFLLYSTILFAVLSLKYNKKIFFGFFFFLLALIPSSGIMPTGVAPVADRYAYLAIAGLAFLLGELIVYLYEKSTYLKVTVIIFTVFLGVSWSYLTYSRNIIWRDSVKLMTEAVEYSPKKASHAYLTRGIILKGQNKINEAEEDFDKSLAINNDNVTIYFHFAHLRQLQKRYDEALKLYSKVPDSYYDFPMVANNVGLILGEQGKDEEAIKYLKKQIIKIGEDEPSVEYLYSNLALLYFKLKDYDESLKYVKLCCEKNPTNYVYYLQQMIIYNEKNDLNKFENVAKEGLEQTKNDVNIVNELAAKYFTLGRYEDVEKLLHKERDLNSDNSAGYFLLGNMSAINGYFKSALIYYTMAILNSKEGDNVGEFYFKRATVYLILNDYKKAKANAEIAEKKGVVPDDDFKNGLEEIGREIREAERKQEEEKKFAERLKDLQENREKAKQNQENIIASDIAAVKHMEERKTEEENKLYTGIKAAKENEVAAKKVTEENISGRLQEMKVNEQKGKQTEEEKMAGELAAIKNSENRKLIAEELMVEKIASIKNMEERKKIEEQNTADRLNAIKNEEAIKEAKKIERSNMLQEGIKTGKMRGLQEQNTSERLSSVKRNLENQKEQEDKIFALMSIAKWKEAVRKQIEEENLAYRLQELRNVENKQTVLEPYAKKDQEEKILAWINICKFREVTRKQIQEEAIVLSLNIKKELSRKELEAKKELESRIFGMLSIFKSKETLRRQIEEENAALRIRAIKKAKANKAKQERIAAEKAKVEDEEIDILEVYDFDGCDEDDENDENFDSSSMFNL